MIRLAKLLAILAMFRYFVFDLIAPHLNFTNGGQITVIMCVSVFALMLSIMFVIKK